LRSGQLAILGRDDRFEILPVSCALVARRKYCVPASSPPVRMPLASDTVMCCSACLNTGFACARLSRQRDSWGLELISLPTHADPTERTLRLLQRRRQRIATLESLRKPLLVPSCATATSIPFDRAARNPPAASRELSASSAADAANALPSDESASALSAARDSGRLFESYLEAQCRLRRPAKPISKRMSTGRPLRQHHRA